jgi:hypothetical protein
VDLSKTFPTSAYQLDGALVVYCCLLAAGKIASSLLEAFLPALAMAFQNLFMSS